MNQINECVELSAGRENMYRFLSEIFKIEISERMLETLKHTYFDSVKESPLNEGFTLIKKFLDNNTADPITDLAVDFARVFLGAGIVEKSLISSPYESVYTSEERLIMQSARDEVVAEYRKYGMDKADKFNVPEDHLAIELEFMSHLCSLASKAYENGNVELARQIINSQKYFLNTHLLNWVPQFCEEIKQFSKTDFYKGIASITTSFIELDKDILEQELLRVE